MAYVVTVEGQYIKVIDTSRNNSYRHIGNICGLESASVNGDVVSAVVKTADGRRLVKLYNAKTGNHIKNLY